MSESDNSHKKLSFAKKYSTGAFFLQNNSKSTIPLLIVVLTVSQG